MNIFIIKKEKNNKHCISLIFGCTRVCLVKKSTYKCESHHDLTNAVQLRIIMYLNHVIKNWIMTSVFMKVHSKLEEINFIKKKDITILETCPRINGEKKNEAVSSL